MVLCSVDVRILNPCNPNPFEIQNPPLPVFSGLLYLRLIRLFSDPNLISSGLKDNICIKILLYSCLLSKPICLCLWLVLNKELHVLRKSY